MGSPIPNYLSEAPHGRVGFNVRDLGGYKHLVYTLDHEL